MGAKSRGNWSSGICLKDCSHKGMDDICSACVRFSNLNSPNPEKFDQKVEEWAAQPTVGKESMRFHPHFNAAFGKYISTKGEYLSEMKKGNFIPTPKDFKEPQRKEYKMNADTHKVIRTIREQTAKDGTFRPSGALKQELIKRNVIMSREKVEKYKQYTGN